MGLHTPEQEPSLSVEENGQFFKKENATMTKRIVALLMALALLCSSIGAFAEHEHVWEDIGWVDDVKPTCTTGATKIQHCTAEGCDPATGARQNVEVGAQGHDFEEKSRVEPTYETKGNVHYQCSRCTATKDEELDKLVSKYGPTAEYTEFIETPDDPHHKCGWYSKKLTVEPTCTEDGYYEILCADCGDIYKYVGDKGARGHDWGNAKPDSVVTKDRTCTEDGEIAYKGHCVRCNQDIEWTEVWEAHGHDYTGVTGVVIHERNCTDDEVQRFTCNECGYNDDRVIPNTKLGHTWETGESEETHDHVIVNPTCAEPGTYGEAVICDRCGAPNPATLITVQNIDAIDHTDEWKKRAFVQVDEDGDVVYYPNYMQFVEDLCNELIALGVLGVDEIYAEIVETIPDENNNTDDIGLSGLEAILVKKVSAATLLKALENVKLELFPCAGYELPTMAEDEVEEGEDEGIVYLMWEDSIPAYDIPIEVQIGNTTAMTTGHVHKTTVAYTPATCTADGKIVLTCTECKAEPYVIELPKLGHEYIPIRGVRGVNDLEYTEIKDCTKANSILQQCLICGHRYNQAIEPAKDHTINLETEEFNPTKLTRKDSKIVSFKQKKEFDSAVIEYKVADADTFDAYKANVIAAFANIATCRDFDIVVECDVPFCVQTVTLHVEAYTKHYASKYEIDIAPTCTVPGYIAFNCEACGKYHTEEVAALRHVPVDGKTIDEPTCTVPGSRQIVCSRCKEVIGTEEIPALDHHWLYYTDPADCKIDKMGEEYRVCSICKTRETLNTFDGHEVGKVSAETKPTCTTPGSITFVCSICHDDVTRVIDATDHNKVVSQIIPATCEPGKEHGVITCYICTNKDSAGRQCTWHEEKDDGTKLEHSMFKTDGSDEMVLNRFVIKTLPTCDAEGAAEYVCSRCNTHVTNYVLPALPHNYQITFNEKEGAYELKCVEMENNALNLWNLAEKMVANAYDAMVASAITTQLGKSTGEYIKGVGCKHVQFIEIRKTEYKVTRLSEIRGQVELVEGALPIKGGEDPYVLLTWMYVLGNGDTVSFTTVREVRETEEDFVYTFKLGGMQVPDDATLEGVYVEVVDDPDADEAPFGTYKIYGQGKL